VTGDVVPTTTAPAGVEASGDVPPSSGARRPGRWDRRLSATAGIWIATALLFVVSLLVSPQSVSSSSLAGMLPFAAILAVVAAGQTLVVQQGGIDLSVPGMVSLGVVILTRIPNGDDGKLLPAALLALLVLASAGLLSGLIVSKVGITPIVTTLGMNALLFGGVMYISGGTPRDTTDLLQDLVTGPSLVMARSAWAAVVVVGVVWVVVKWTVGGRWFEAIGASRAASRAAGLQPARFEIGAYVGAAVLYFVGALLLAGVVQTPSAFQGESYLLPSVAAVVLGGTSLLGGVGSVIATAGGALFLTQLQQLVLTTDLSAGVSRLIEAAAIAIGVAVHSLGSAGPAALSDPAATQQLVGPRRFAATTKGGHSRDDPSADSRH
jgi:ribose transport system permease protein